jgi:hypothetical protein
MKSTVMSLLLAVLTTLSMASLVNGIDDVELGPSGMLKGKVVNVKGTPVAGAPVVIRQGDRVVQTTTNSGGVFTARGLRGGTWEVTTGQTTDIYRCWAPGTAPPSGRSEATLVPGRGRGHIERVIHAGPHLDAQHPHPSLPPWRRPAS